MVSELTVEKQIEKVLKLREDEDLTFEAIGERLGFSEKTARRRYQQAAMARGLNAVEAVEEKLDRFPENDKIDIIVDSPYLDVKKTRIERFQPLLLKGNAIVTADYHIPLHDASLINAMISCARKYDIKQLIIAGDYFNMDTFSSYLPHQPEAAWSIEKVEGNRVAKTLLESFDKIVITWGNHDFRLTKAVGFKHSFSECMEWALDALTDDEKKRIQFSDLDYMYYEPGDGRRYRVCHPTEFSSIPLTVPRSLATKYNESVISAHSHHCSMGVAPNGHDVIMEPGGFFDKNRTEYIQKTTKHHEWAQGWIMFNEQQPNLYSPVFNNVEQFMKGGKNGTRSKT